MTLVGYPRLEENDIILPLGYLSLCLHQWVYLPLPRLINLNLILRRSVHRREVLTKGQMQRTPPPFGQGDACRMILFERSTRQQSIYGFICQNRLL